MTDHARARGTRINRTGPHQRAEIARDLQLSPLTAKTHVSRILMKLGARDRVQLVVIAYQSGLVKQRQTEQGSTARTVPRDRRLAHWRPAFASRRYSRAARVLSPGT
jgi:hypothetical protein